MEIELKLLIAPADVAALRQSPLLSQFALGASDTPGKPGKPPVAQPVTQQLLSIYFDTPDLHLKKHRSALRVRRAGEVWIQTYKGGGSVAAGLHQRHEWEGEVAGPHIELAALLPLIDNPAALQALQAPGLAARLEEMFTTRFARTCWILHLPRGTEVELALDQGVVEAAGRSEAICEVELELKSGETDELLAFSQALRRAIPLQASNISKAQRGFALRHPQGDSSL